MTTNGEPRERPGRIVAVRGSVVEVEFPDALPTLNEAIRVTSGDRRLILEVAYHVDSPPVRFADGLFYMTPTLCRYLLQATGRAAEEYLETSTVCRARE